MSPILLHLRPGVREQYLPWLERTRPDLLPLYERMYPRSYASSVEQKKLSALVHRLVAKHGGVTRPAVKSRDVSEKRTRAAPAAARQLGLGV